VSLRLRNTLSRTVEPVRSLEAAAPDAAAPDAPPRIRMYTCGPTVYRYAHVGNLRSFLLADFIRRALLYHGFDVLHVKNITDVGHMRDERLDQGGDRLVLAAEVEGKTTQQIADFYEAAFHADEAAVNILPAHRFPRATEHIPQMLSLAERLVDGGHAYATPDGTVYFDVSAFPGYGLLSGNSLDDLREGHRVDVEPDKDDPADFALWKHAEQGRLLKWPTARWGEGFPGWHLECSAMSLAYLGERFEIHTGGIDNVFPHHEDEIAQSAAASGIVPAAHWVHGEHLLMRGRKMAKSAGNFQRVTELAAEGIDPLAFRYLALTSRYRHKLDYSDASLRSAASGLESLRGRMRALGAPPTNGAFAAPPVLLARPAGDRPTGGATHAGGHGSADQPTFPLSDRATGATTLSNAGDEFHRRFVKALDDDLDLPGALAALREALRSDLPDDEKRWLALDADLVLGLGLDRTWDTDARDPLAGAELPPRVQVLVQERSEARSTGNYAEADRLRKAIEELGFELIDRADGTDVRLRD
jgi:cysteinyl-tRNA synthetase